MAALTLSGAADDTVLDDVIRLLGDKSLGMDRAPLLLALIRSKSSKAKMTLLELRDDPDLGKQIKTFRRLERHQKAISASKQCFCANHLTNLMNKEWYAYDGYGRRVIACGSAACNYQLYSQLGQLLYTQDARKGINTDYIYLAGSVVALRARPASGGAETVTYQHTDALGSPVATTNAAGQVVERTQYEPYGAAIGKTVDGVGYTGHAMDGGTGLIYMQQRYYDPTIGRFLSIDSIPVNRNTGSGFNVYIYAAGNPYKFKDPDGRCEKVTGSNICQRGIAWSIGPIDTGGGSRRPLNFSVEAGVKLGAEAYSKVSQTADNFSEKTGKKLVVTDGMRTSADQAARMRYKIANGAGVREYANKAAAREILAAYTEAIASQQDPVSAMAAEIQKQVNSGIYISKHLRGRVRISEIVI